MPADDTYVPLFSTTLGSAQASVTFSSIPSTYTDLVLVCMVQTQTNSDAVTLRFNGDSGTNYSYTQLRGDGTTTFSARVSNATMMRIGNDIPNTTAYGTIISNIQNYSNSTTNKTVISRSGSAASSAFGTQATVGLWRSTAAITSLTVLPNDLNTFLSGSTFNLYGIKAA